MLCDGEGHPLHFELTAGQTHEAAAFDAVMIGVDEHLRDAAGEPIAWPVALAGDKGYRAGRTHVRNSVAQIALSIAGRMG